MNAKFLVVKTNEDGEIINLIRVCEKYSPKDVDGYEVYEIKKNGKIGEIVKSFESYSERGFVLADWRNVEDEGCGYITFNDVKVIDKISISTREDFIKTKQFKNWKKYVEDSEFIENYKNEILNEGSFAEDFDEDKQHWFVITEYKGNILYRPY